MLNCSKWLKNRHEQMSTLKISGASGVNVDISLCTEMGVKSNRFSGGLIPLVGLRGLVKSRQRFSSAGGRSESNRIIFLATHVSRKSIASELGKYVEWFRCLFLFSWMNFSGNNVTHNQSYMRMRCRHLDDIPLNFINNCASFFTIFIAFYSRLRACQRLIVIFLAILGCFSWCPCTRLWTYSTLFNGRNLKKLCAN